VDINDAASRIKMLADRSVTACPMCAAVFQAVVIRLSTAVGSDLPITPPIEVSPKEIETQYKAIMAANRRSSFCEVHLEGAMGGHPDWRNDEVKDAPPTDGWKKMSPQYMAANLAQRGWLIIGVQQDRGAPSSGLRQIPSVLLAHELEKNHRARCERPLGAQ
jgi:hypothetical protein